METGPGGGQPSHSELMVMEQLSAHHYQPVQPANL